MTEPEITPGAPEVHTGTDVGDGRETRPGQTPKPNAPETDGTEEEPSDDGKQS